MVWSAPFGTVALPGELDGGTVDWGDFDYDSLEPLDGDEAVC